MRGKVIYESDEFNAIGDLKAAAVTCAFLNDKANVEGLDFRVHDYSSRGCTGYRTFATIFDILAVITCAK